MQDVAEALFPPTAAGAEDFLGEDGSAHGHVDGVQVGVVETFPIEAGGGCRAVGEPEHRHIVQHLVLGQNVLRVARIALAAIAPRMVLLHDPSHLPHRRIREAVAQSLGAGALLFGVARFLGLILGDAVQRGAFHGRHVLQARFVRRANRHVHMKGGAMLGFAQPHVLRDEGAPVAALRHIAAVAEPGHELAPHAADLLRADAGLGRLAGEAVAGEGGGDEVESIAGVLRLREGIDDFVKLDDGAGPAVGNNEGQGVRMGAADMQEVNVDAVDGGDELRPAVEFRLPPAPIVLRRPIVRQFLGVSQGHALAPIRDGLRLGPTRAADALPQAVQLRLGNSDGERFDVGHGGIR